jgi:hypothetical protein
MTASHHLGYIIQRGFSLLHGYQQHPLCPENKKVPAIARTPLVFCGPSYNGLLAPLPLPMIREITNKMMKITNKILAIPAAPAAIPPNPKMAAMIATTKNITVQRNIALSFRMI